VYTLVARDGRGRVIAAIPVTRRPLTIGRATECTLVLPSTAVSRTHASVYLREDGSAVIQDEGSANGVQVNGAFVTQPTLINEASQISISDYSFALEPKGEVVAPIAPEPSAEREELETILEAQVGAGTILANTSVVLVGRGGPFDGTTYTIDKPLMTVGRVEGNDVVLDDPSISRRHAQIRLSATASRFTVLDLRSSNGTYVDGKRIKRSECGAESIVRFGDLAFKVTLVSRASEKPKRKIGRRALLVGAFAVVLLLVAVGIVAKIKQPKPPPPRKTTAADRLRELQATVQRLVDQGKRKLAQRQWSEAVRSFDMARAEDPLNAEAGQLRQQALTELGHKQTYAKGLEFLSLGNKENLVKAKEIFLKIPTESIYHRDVRYRLRTIDDRLSEGYRIEGVSRCKARYWKECHEALCKFFNLLSEGRSVPGESQLRGQLEGVEKRLKRQRDFVPCEAPRFLNPQGTEPPGERPEDLLAEKYTEKALQGVMLLYFNGRIENALKQVQRLANDRQIRPHWAALREINRQLLIIRGKYQEGYSAHRDRNVHEAARHWGMVLTADAALIPPRIESFYRREVKRGLGDLYFELGDEEAKVMRYRQAYAMWSKGQAINDAHERILNGLLQLEAVGERLVREARQLTGEGKIAEAREKLEMAKSITEENRPVHQEAIKQLGAM